MALAPDHGTEAAALDLAAGYLRCPQCAGGGSLTRIGRVLRCPAGHSFDIARSGYVNLLPAAESKNPGDTAAMVSARREFLSAGHFSGLAAAIADTAVAHTSVAASWPRCVIDVGAGTGYYLAAVLDPLAGWTGLALDISKSALRLAASCHPRAAAVGCDAWRRLPVADEVADIALNLFAPRGGSELSRILRPAGRLIVGTPTTEHLAELVKPLGLLTVDQRKQERLDRKLRPYFDQLAASVFRCTLNLDQQAVSALAAMGPGSWHTDPEALRARVARLPEPVQVTVAVTISVHCPTAA